MTTDVAGGNGSVFALGFQSDGKIVGAGGTESGAAGDFTLLRYESGLIPDLAVAKSASIYSVGVGDSVTYLLTVTNFGSLGVPGAPLTDFLPGSMIFLSSSGAPCTTPPVNSSGTVICTLRPIGPRQSTTVRVVANAAAPGVSTNTVTVRSTRWFQDTQHPRRGSCW